MTKTGSRHRARESAFQMLYQWEVGRAAPDAVVADYEAIEQDENTALTPVNRRFAEALVAGTVAHVAEIDQRIAAHAQNWRIERMAAVDRLILRLAIYELAHASDTPPSVVIDEALELARTFGEEDSVRFVNGVLDAVFKSLP
ncbi:MAG: transcription antitermination factor NusB [Acidobacteriota bacterium]